MALVQEGDDAAYEQLYSRWHRSLFAFLLRRTGSQQRAEEALQDTFLKLFRHRKRYQPGRPFKSWVFTIAVNAGRDAWRPRPEIFRLRPAAAPCPPETKDLLVRALHLLPAKQRRLLLLSAEGFNATEIAEMMSIKPGAVRMRLSRARAAVRQNLGGLDA